MSLFCSCKTVSSFLSAFGLFSSPIWGLQTTSWNENKQSAKFSHNEGSVTVFPVKGWTQTRLCSLGKLVCKTESRYVLRLFSYSRRFSSLHRANKTMADIVWSLIRSKRIWCDFLVDLRSRRFSCQLSLRGFWASWAFWALVFDCVQKRRSYQDLCHPRIVVPTHCEPKFLK